VKSTLLIIAWVLAVAGLYVGLVILEFYWNVPEWQPRLDFRALVLIWWVMATLAFICFLARISDGPLTQAVSLLLCLALCALAVHVFPPEAAKTGLFGRESPSALWYRAQVDRQSWDYPWCFGLSRSYAPASEVAFKVRRPKSE